MRAFSLHLKSSSFCRASSICAYSVIIAVSSDSSVGCCVDAGGRCVTGTTILYLHAESMFCGVGLLDETLDYPIQRRANAQS